MLAQVLLNACSFCMADLRRLNLSTAFLTESWRDKSGEMERPPRIRTVPARKLRTISLVNQTGFWYGVVHPLRQDP